MALTTQANIEQPDEFYQALIEAHAGLSEQQSAALNARLILLLANQVGDLATLKEAIAAARAPLAREDGAN
jgi:anthranilate phosphoribosyltransferase